MNTPASHLRLLLLLLSHLVLSSSSQALGQQSSIFPLEQAEAACTRPVDPVCLVTITTPQSIVLQSAHTTPRNLTLRFQPGGLWDVHGAELTVASGQIDAPEDARIFTATSAVRGLRTARPEWFAQPTPQGFPPEALAQAYRATIPGGTVLLRNAIYLSPFFNPKGTQTCMAEDLLYKTSRLLLGVTRPTVDNEEHPTKLVGGTILKGEICGAAPLKAAHLGVDAGPDAVSHLFGGRPSFGIALFHHAPLHQVRGTTLNDLSVLTTGMPSQHSVIIEGEDDLTVNGLWLWTLGGAHGLIVKSSNATIRDFHCKGASSECLLIKSDAATNGAGFASNILVDGVTISFLQHPGDTAGIVLDSRWDSIQHVTLTHILEQGTSYGIGVTGSLFYRIHDILIADWTANVSNLCLGTDYGRYITVQHFACAVKGELPGTAFILNGRDIRLTDGTIACQPSNPACSGNPVDGILDLATATTLDHIHATGLTGYLLRNRSQPDESTNDLTTSGMQLRLHTLYHPPAVPLTTLLQTWISLVKPYLRIIYTTFQTRIRILEESVR